MKAGHRIEKRTVTISLPARYWKDLDDRAKKSGYEPQDLLSYLLIWQWPTDEFELEEG